MRTPPPLLAANPLGLAGLTVGRESQPLDGRLAEGRPELAQLVDTRPGLKHRRVWVTPDLNYNDLLARLLAINLERGEASK